MIRNPYPPKEMRLSTIFGIAANFCIFSGLLLSLFYPELEESIFLTVIGAIFLNTQVSQETKEYLRELHETIKSLRNEPS